jgi:serine phosphatase RsbU (regulator of sigma subunit)
VVESDNYDDYVKLKSENKILRNENKKLMALEKQTSNESLIEENKNLKQEKENLKTGLSKFTRGQHLQSELLMNTVIKMDRSGIGYLANQEKKAKAQQQ